MSAKRVFSTLLVLAVMMSGTSYAFAADAVPPPPGAEATPTAPAGQITPARVSYLNGEVSFWRPGATDWTPATVNTPLAPGDVFYTGTGGTVEIQVGPRAFVRAAPGAQIALDNHEPDYIQFRLTAGHAALDIRELDPGDTVELDTPGAAFTIERNGYYHAEVTDDTTAFRVDRAGSATMTPAGGAVTPVAASEQVVVTGTESPRVVVGAAPALTAWDQWNFQRTDYLTQSTSARYVPAGVYGTETLDQNGTWRNVETYGNVWVPATVAPGWVPYSTGRWIWDPRFGWTWLDNASWGWAPYHYGRWVYVHNYWAWAPGPIVVRPVYSPALVVFLGGGVHVSVGRPVYWAPLGWGEPVIPWWGRRGFVGVASWHGWGGPRVVNNVVVNRTTVVNVQNINVYRNVTVNNAVVGVSADRFGRGPVAATRVNATEVRRLAPVRGAPEVRPVAASVTAGSGPAAKPPVSVQNRPVVATRAPRDHGPALREQGLAEGKPTVVQPAPKIVPAPRPTVTRTEPARRDDRPAGAPDRVDRNDRNERGDRGARPAPPAPRVRDEARPEPKLTTPPQPMPAPAPVQPTPRVPGEGRPEPKLSPPGQRTPAPAPVPPTPRVRDGARPEPKLSTPPAPAPTPPPARAQDGGRPEPRPTTPGQPPPAPGAAPRVRDEGRPEPKLGAPQAPAPAPAPRIRDDRRSEPRLNVPAQPTAAPVPAPAAPAVRPREETRPAPGLRPPAQPALAPAPVPRAPTRIERPAQAERPAPVMRPAPVERPAPAPALRSAPAPVMRPAPVERPAAVQPEPRTRRLEPVAPGVGAGGSRGNRGKGEIRAVPESGPRTRIRD